MAHSLLAPRTMRSLLSLVSWVPARGLVVGAVLLASCTSNTEDAEQELNTRLRGQRLLYLGCAGACPPSRVCGGEALAAVTRDLAKAPLVIEGVGRGGGEVRNHAYYFVDARGAGTMYYERSSDISPCEGCGWYRESFTRMALEVSAPVGDFSRGLRSTGRVTLVSDIDRADYSIGPEGCE